MRLAETWQSHWYGRVVQVVVSQFRQSWEALVFKAKDLKSYWCYQRCAGNFALTQLLYLPILLVVSTHSSTQMHRVETRIEREIFTESKTFSAHYVSQRGYGVSVTHDDLKIGRREPTQYPSENIVSPLVLRFGAEPKALRIRVGLYPKPPILDLCSGSTYTYVEKARIGALAG